MWSENLTFVIQGGLDRALVDRIKNIKSVFIYSSIIVSTTDSMCTYEELIKKECDLFLKLPDPGHFFVTKENEYIRSENINRQIVTTSAGLENVNTSLVAKFRTDHSFDVQMLYDYLIANLDSILNEKKIVVSSYKTANPFFNENFVFHISDWLYIGNTKKLKKLITSKPIPQLSEYSEVPCNYRGLFPISKFTCEQWMLRAGLSNIYNINLDSHSDSAKIYDFLNFIKVHLILLNPKKILLITNKYDDLFYLRPRRLNYYVYHYLACVWMYESTLPLKVFAAVLKIKASLHRAVSINFFK